MVLGIDPGLSGGLGLLNRHGGLLCGLAMPLKLRGTKREVDAVAVVEIIEKFRLSLVADEELIVIMERQHAFPGMGVIAAYSKGDSSGTIRGICAAMGLSLEYVAAATWKAYFHLQGGVKNKERSRSLATELFPLARLERKKDEGIGESLLIARWFCNTRGSVQK